MNIAQTQERLKQFLTISEIRKFTRESRELANKKFKEPYFKKSYVTRRLYAVLQNYLNK